MFNIKKYNEINDLLKKTSNSAKIVAISKNHPLKSILEAVNLGVYIFGENRVQEAQEKFQKLKQDNKKIELHLTGPLQSNKVKTAIQLFDVFHTLDREKIAREFSKHSELLVSKKFFLQVNTGKEKTKSGIFPEDTKDFLFFLRQEMKLPITGLMCIPPIDDDPTYHFKQLKLLANDNKINELSIGMSDDYEQAIQFNPTYIRLGTILFGKRL
ncbi:YggS family pyridoxal phosphate-dependent enzyme [Pelagibacteraceae bacterium]|nr:YggS family pyridoxal phosphate-dependent enzyme [Pelagibacteraceae bacterium]